MKGTILALGVVAMACASFEAAAQQQPVAPTQMSRADLEAEVAASRALVSNGAVQPSRPAGCTAAENRQFDFWLGEWDVSPTGETAVIAESTITSVAQGCIVMENWRPFQGAHGYSISTFDQNDHKWHQEYAGAGGRRSHMRGEFANGVLRMDIDAPTGGAASPGVRRMTYQQLDANTVRQWGEMLRDGQWQITFDLTYRRRAGTR